MHEGYNHEPGAKGVVATLHACESLRRTGSSRACGDRRVKGDAIASRVVNRTSGALKQYEYPICEITKTGLLPPGVINTGEFVHHRACGVWAGGRRDAPMFYRVLSLARELAWRMRADVPRVTTGAAPACHCTATSPASPAARCQPLASQIEASTGESGCVRSLGPAKEPCSGSAQLQPAKLYLASHRHSRRRAGVQNRPARPLHTALPAKGRRPIFKQLRRDSNHGRNCVRYNAGGRDAQAQAAEESFQTAVGCASL